jgi:hypothetical protein
MKGEIVAINNGRGLVAVQTEDGDYSIFRLLGGNSVEVGDEVSWAHATCLGSTSISNHTKGENLEVFFQNHNVPKSQAKQQLLT